VNGNEFSHDGQGPIGGPGGSDEEATMPIGIGAMDDDDSLGAADPFSQADESGKRGLNSGAVLLVAVVLIAIAGLFSMRTLTRASAAHDEPHEAEKSIESFLSMLQSSKSEGESPNYQLGAEETAVLDVLNESYASRQVALTHVQRNPFIIFEDSAGSDTPSKPSGPDPMEQKREERRKLFAQAAGRLELRSVLMGNTPLATIGTNIVQVGATVVAEPEGVTFTVTTISNDGVQIVAEDKELGVRHESLLTIDRERSRTRRSSPHRSHQRGPVRPR